MADNLLTTYLHDHLAGSVSAIQLVEHCIEQNRTNHVGSVLERLLPEIREDQALLEALAARTGASESPVKKAGAWLMEKVSRLKLQGGGELDLLEQLEGLQLGIHGKRSLWRLMQAVCSRDARFSDVDFARLEARAAAQHDQVEQLRLGVAAELFAPDGGA